MLNHNIFVVWCFDDLDGIGKYAIAEKIPANSNLFHYCECYKDHVTVLSMNICKTWKDAQKLAETWNDDFIANGQQKSIV